MPGPCNPPLTAEEPAARAIQAENDTAALFLVWQAAQIEAAAAKAASTDSPGNEPARHVRIAAYRNAAARLVLANRPVSLGVPKWMVEVAPRVVTASAG